MHGGKERDTMLPMISQCTLKMISKLLFGGEELAQANTQRDTKETEQAIFAAVWQLPGL